MDKTKIDLGDGFKIVAEPNPDTQFREMMVYLEGPDGYIVQDLAIVRQAYEISETHRDIQHPSTDMEVLVYGDHLSEDYTQKTTIKRFVEEE